MDVFFILVAIAVLFCLLIATVVFFVAYCGIFESVEVGAGTPPLKSAIIAYKFAKGPYKNCGPLFPEAAKVAPDNKALGIYYDDPDKVVSSLRCQFIFVLYK